jgi:spermidine synthase
MRSATRKSWGTSPELPETWFTEASDDPAGQRLQMARILHADDTGPQRIRIFDNPAFGRVLALDGYVQTTAEDEFIYHEMLAHVPLFAHGAARDVLIIGGGDGGTLREVLRHRCVERAVLVEIDPRVVALSRRYLPSISAEAFDDPRADVVIRDGSAFIRETTALFDVILIDSTDPVGPGAKLSSAAFFGLCRARLRPGGILVIQSGVSFMQRDLVRRAAARLRRVFRDVAVYSAAVPTYYGGLMTFTWASDDFGKRATSAQDLAARYVASGIATRCYTPDLHRAAFVLPGYLEDALSEPAALSRRRG